MDTKIGIKIISENGQIQISNFYEVDNIAHLHPTSVLTFLNKIIFVYSYTNLLSIFNAIPFCPPPSDLADYFAYDINFKHKNITAYKMLKNKMGQIRVVYPFSNIPKIENIKAAFGG